MPRSAAPTRLLTIQAAAERLDVCPKTIRRYISEGRLPAYRLAGKSVRLRPDDVDGLLVPIPTAQG